MIGWEFPPHITGGLGIASMGLAHALCNRGHEVVFLLPKVYGDEPVVPGLRLFGYADLIPQEAEKARFTLDAYKSDEVGGGYSNDIQSQIRRYVRAAILLVRKIKPNLVHAHDWMTFPAGNAAASMAGVPFFAHIHSIEKDRSGGSPNSVIVETEQIYLNRADAIIAVSNFTKEAIRTQYQMDPSKIFTVYNGVVLPKKVIKAKKTIQSKVVLFLGRVTPQKGPEFFVRAAAKIAVKFPDVKFVIAGSGDLFESMIELAADLGIGKHFHYTGFLNREQVNEMYQISDLFVLPSVSEPFGISPLEAVSYNVPVIISRQSGISETIENCIKVDFWNVEELSNAMDDLLSHPAKAHAMAEKALVEATEVTWEKAAKDLEILYRRYIR